MSNHKVVANDDGDGCRIVTVNAWNEETTVAWMSVQDGKVWMDVRRALIPASVFREAVTLIEGKLKEKVK